MRKFLRASSYVAVLTAAGLIGPAHAATETGQLGVSITIAASCTLGTIAPVDFGSQGALTSNIDAQGSIAVTCTDGAAYEVGLDAGNGLGATVASRKMTGPGGATVDYQLYSDSARTDNWGETANTDTVAGTGSGSAQTIPVYGRIASQITPAPGTYTDTVNITVTY